MISRHKIFRIVFALLLVFLVASLGNSLIKEGREPLPEYVIEGENHYFVVKVIDGDTIDVDLNGVTERVRLAGIDAPELARDSNEAECLAEAATNFLQNLVSGREIILLPDSLQENRDQYGRLIRYVYLTDGNSINEALLSEGVVIAADYFEYDEKKYFNQLERDAKKRVSVHASDCTN